MKKLLLFASVMAMGLTAFAQNPFAYNASTGDATDQDLPVNYTLNAAAERVVVDFIDANGAIAKSVELGDEFLTAGDHAASVSIEGLESGQTYSLAIRVKGAALEAPVQCDPVYTFWSPYGIAIDNNPMSKHFGRVLVTECQPSINDKIAGSAYWTSNQNGGVGVGLYDFDPQLNRLQNPDGTYGYAVPWVQENYAYADYTGGTGNNFALKKVKISKDGRIFVGGLDVKNGEPLCEVNPDNLAEWTPIFVGEKSNYEASKDCNLYDADGNFVAGYSACFAVTGEGENLKIMNLSSTLGQVFAYYSYKTYEYPLGTATSWDAAASLMDQVPPLTGQYTISAQSVSIDYDPNGNLWYAQYRGAPNEAQPTMKHVSKNSDGEWEEDYSFITDPDNGFAFNRGGGIACSPDGSKLAFSTGNFKLTVADVTYAENGAPTIDMANAVTVTSTDVRGFNDIAWDYAGNLYACDNGKETFRRFAFPRTATAKEGDPNEVSTPLRPEFNFTVPTATSVTDMNVNKAIASVEYVNINGQVSSTPFKGVNVVVTRYADGSKSVTKLVK